MPTLSRTPRLHLSPSSHRFVDQIASSGWWIALLCLVGLSSQGSQAFGQVLRVPQAISVNTSSSLTATVTVTRPGQVDAVKLRTLGNDGYDFSDAGGGSCRQGATLLTGQSCTVNLAFTPKAPGGRRGAVVLLDSNGGVLGSTLLLATATGPMGTFVPGTMNTVAGDSVWIYAGDGGLATQTSIFLPFGVAVDAAGNLYIADASNNRIRKVTAATNLMSTIAGNGVIGVTGDGGPASLAALSNPTSVVVDAMGNVYFSDSGNNVVRRIDAFTGLLSTIAGTLGRHGYAGDGLPATAAMLNGPNGINFDDNGDLYIADTNNNVIRKVTISTGIITTIAGTGSPGYTGNGGAATSATLNAPWGITVSSSQTLYIADQGNHAIRTVSAAGVMSTLVGNGTSGFTGDNGPASAAQLNAPAGTVLDIAGNLYIADSGNNRVRKVNAVTGVIATIAGNDGESFEGDTEPANIAGLYGPYTLALDSQGNLLIADVFHNRIRQVSASAARLDYPAIRVGRVSAPKKQMFENDGNAALHVSTLTPVSNSAVDTTATTCLSSTVLNPLDQCVVSTEFAPTSIGDPVLGTLNVGSDAANSPGVITLSGEVLSVDPTTLTLTSSVNPSATGTPVVITVTATSAGTTPTGQVTLLDGTTKLGTVALSAGTASFTLSTLTAGQHTLTATYGGDTSNAAGTSTPLVQVVKDAVAATTTSLSSASNPVVAGAPLLLSASVQVSVAGSGIGSISGSVTFFDGTTPIGSGTVANNGVATLSVTSLTVGTHTLTAVYGGNTNYGTSTSAALSEKVTIASTVTLVGSSANPSIAGGSLQITGTVAGTGGVPGGTVSFQDGATKLGSATLNAQGVATLTVSGSVWTVGTHSLTASYAGDPADTPSASAALSQTVVLASTTIVLSSSNASIGLGAAVTLTASLKTNGGVPTGSVTFFDGTTSVGTGVINASGVASMTTSSLPLGTRTMTAVYAGDSLNGGATSAAVQMVVETATTSVALTSAANPSLYGSPLVLTANVTGTGSAPTGTVVFMDNGVAIGTSPVNAAGTAALTSTTLAIGAHRLVASYGGDLNHAATASSVLTQNILQSTTTSLNASALQSVAGSALNWTVLVKGASGAPTTGLVKLMDGATVLATLTPDNNGSATFSTSALMPGTHTIVANFAGDATDAASSSAPAVTVVTIASTSTRLSSSANPALSGSSVTFTAVVTGNGGVPGGTVTFLDGAAALGTVSVTGSSSSSAMALLTLSSLTPGVHSIVAQYTGDTLDAPSVSTSLNEQINQQTSISLASGTNPSLLSDNVNFTVTLANGSAAAPTGTVTLNDGATVVGTATLTATGTASFTLAAPSLGQHSMTAVYAGDPRNAPVTSQVLLQTVVLRPTTNTLTASTTALSAGQQEILISVVQGGGPRAPTGTVTFASGSTVLGTVAINAAGVATLTLTPQQGSYGVVSNYSGDALFAPSTSSAVSVTVGPPTEFLITLTPATMSMQSGQHGTTTINLTTAATFKDTLSFGCAGLPSFATCTFSQNQMAVSNGLSKTFTVTLDTGNPLGAGPTARLISEPGTGMLACMLPAGILLLFGRRKMRRPLGLLILLLTLAGVSTLSGCGNSLTVNSTPAGSYTFQVVGTGATTGATSAGTMQLTVTK